MSSGVTTVDYDDIEPLLDAPRLCLIVDDSRTIRRFTARILEEMKFVVAQADTGLSAVECCRAVVPDVILLDWNMPEMDGITCLKHLRAMPLDPRPTIVMCTTENGLPKIQEALEAGADEYIMKPFDKSVLLDKFAQFGLVEQD
jgi:two-component system chemotaxis response regulator CheY